MRRVLPWIVDLAVVALVIWRVLPLFQALPARVTFPGDIEWMEGATLVSAQRVFDGQGIYGDPALDYIPFIYPPLYAWVIAAFGHLFPIGYTLARTISAVSAGVATAVLAVGARREGASWGVAIGCAGLFLSCWDDGGTFYDLVRTDSLSIMLLSAALVFGKAKNPWPGALLLAVAFAAKQHAAMFGLPILIWRWRTYGRRDGLVYAAASAGPALLFLGLMGIATHGGFWTWLVAVPAVHGIVGERLFPQAQIELWKILPIATTAGLILPMWWKRNPYWSTVSLMGLFVASMMRGHVGGFVNVLIPAFWIQSLWPVLAANGWKHPAARYLAAVLVAAQLWQNKLEVKKYVPTEADRDAAVALVEKLRTLPEPILMPHGPWYLVMAGKTPSFALICLWDADRKLGPMHKAVDLVEDAMRDQHWKSAVLPDDKLGFGLKDAYARDPKQRIQTVATRVGWRVRFSQIWLPKGSTTTP